MKIKLLTYIISSFSILILILTPKNISAESEFVYLSVREASILSAPKNFSPVKGKITYGTPLEKIAESGSWIQVKNAKGVTGYIHISALTARKLNLVASTNASNSKVDNSDISLAGKGFSVEVEKQLSAKDGQLNYADVNKLEKIQVTDSEIKAFIQSGKLNL